MHKFLTQFFFFLPFLSLSMSVADDCCDVALQALDILFRDDTLSVDWWRVKPLFDSEPRQPGAKWEQGTIKSVNTIHTVDLEYWYSTSSSHLQFYLCFNILWFQGANVNTSWTVGRFIHIFRKWVIWPGKIIV